MTENPLPDVCNTKAAERLPCGICGADAYVCDRPKHGTATWAIHCTAGPGHNYFADDAPAGNASTEVEVWKARHEQVKAQRDTLRDDLRFLEAGLVQVGWMLSPDLASELNITPVSEEYLITLEQAEQDGGIKDEFANRVIPIYRKADDATHF